VTARIDAGTLRERLLTREELALLDAREQGVHARGHPFVASCAPLSRLELMIGDLVPRRSAPIVAFDGGTERLAERAAAKLREIGYTDVSVLDGGCVAWQAAGGELFSGVNVPSKAFGEFVEHRYDTPRVPAEELKRLAGSGRKLVIVDARPFQEYMRMAIPGAVDVPGAELAWRVHELAPDPDTLVVVSCAGRTRSIIGCQALRNAGIPNEVVALKDGTMGWQLAGFEVERDAKRVAPSPGEKAKAKALESAARVARRFGVRSASRAEVQGWLKDETRTTYLLDVRSWEEFHERRISGVRQAPGGQLVQATDEFLAVRNARVVLFDPERVRAVMTASWLAQMGWEDVFVLEGGFEGWKSSTGPRKTDVPLLRAWPAVAVEDFNPRAATVIDFSTSLRFRAHHIPGAWWAVRARLEEARREIGEAKQLVLTSEDGALAQLAAPEVQALWPKSPVGVLDGGNAAWILAARETEGGTERATTALDDVWYKPYDRGPDYEKHARAYLTWEVGLVEQIQREPTARFREYP
jgi:rhodanese-related sulfurtransferase